MDCLLKLSLREFAMKNEGIHLPTFSVYNNYIIYIYMYIYIYINKSTSST